MGPSEAGEDVEGLWGREGCQDWGPEKVPWPGEGVEEEGPVGAEALGCLGWRVLVQSEPLSPDGVVPSWETSVTAEHEMC